MYRLSTDWPTGAGCKELVSPLLTVLPLLLIEPEGAISDLAWQPC